MTDLEHDPEVHGPDADLFYAACRRCVWLLRMRHELWRLPGLKTTERVVALIQGKPQAQPLSEPELFAGYGVPDDERRGT